MSTTYDDIIIKSDSKKLILGAAGAATDAYVYFDGTDLTFFDSNVGDTKTLTELAAGGSPTLDNAFDNGKLIDSSTATGAANAFSVGGAAADDKIEIYHTSTEAHINARADDLYITAAGGDIQFDNENLVTTGKVTADGGLEIGADNVNLTLGANDGTDSKIFFDGSGNLTFYDSNHGSNVTLSDMTGSNLNSPTVIGDMTFSDGKLTIADTSDEEVLGITADSVTTNSIVSISGDGITTGNLMYLSATEATLNGGAYIQCYDETAGAAVFKVKEDGEVEITGTDGSDMLTLTAGDIQLTSGDIDIDAGIITIDTTANEGSKIARNNATGTNAVLEIEQTHASGGIALLIDQNATGDNDAVSITNAGTGFAVTTTAGAAGGEGFEYIAAASGTGVGFRGDGSTGSWIGAADVGFIDIDTDGALAAGANLLRLDATGASEAGSYVCEILSSGNLAGATDGACLLIAESGAAQATSYAVNISSTNNEALHVDAGQSLFDERVSITLADNTGPALAITNPDTTGNTNAVTVTPSGSGAGIAISPQETDTQGLLITTLASSTVPLIDIDATTGAGWVGGADTGCLDISADGALVADATLVRLASSGQPAAANDGVCLDVKETGDAQATSYAVRIASTNNEALHVDSGLVDVDESVRINPTSAGAGYGHIKIGGTANHGGAAGENVITIWNGAAKPAGALADAASFFAEGGEMDVIDSGGNETTLSPHTEDGDYVINSFVPGKNTTLRIHIEQICDFLVEKFPEIANLVERIDGRDMAPKKVKSPKRAKGNV